MVRVQCTLPRTGEKTNVVYVSKVRIAGWVYALVHITRLLDFGAEKGGGGAGHLLCGGLILRIFTVQREGEVEHAMLTPRGMDFENIISQKSVTGLICLQIFTLGLTRGRLFRSAPWVSYCYG